MGERVRIGVVAPSSFIDPAVPDEVTAFARAQYGDRVELVFDPQCSCTVKYGNNNGNLYL